MLRIPGRLCAVSLALAAVLAACDSGPQRATEPETQPSLTAVGDTNVETHWRMRNNTRGFNVRVVDGDGAPMVGVEVSFAIAGPGQLVDTHAVTSAEGVATTSFNPANEATPVVLTATATGVPGAVRYRVNVVPHWLEITPSSAALTPEAGCGVYLLGLVESLSESSGWLNVDFRAEDPTIVRISVPNQSGNLNGIRVVAVGASRAGTTRVIGRAGLMADTTQIEVPASCVATD